MSMATTHELSSSLGRVRFVDSGGEGLPVMLVHGLPMSRHLWAPVMALLPETIRAVALDLNDYGESEGTGGPITHVQRAQVLDELREHLGWERFALVAHDLGASVAVDYMGLYGERVSQLVLMSPPVYPDFKEPPIVKLVRVPGLGEWLIDTFGALMLRGAILYGMTHRDRLKPELWGAFSATLRDERSRAALLRNLRWGRPHEFFAQYPQLLKQVTIPTLVIYGLRDPYIPVGQVEQLERDLKDVRRVDIVEGSHFLPIDTPEAVARALTSFLLKP